MISARRQRHGLGGHFKGPLPTPPEPLQLALFGEQTRRNNKPVLDGFIIATPDFATTPSGGVYYCRAFQNQGGVY